MATTFEMSQDTPPDLNNGFMKFMSCIFAPMLKDNFSEHASPFAIKNPLTLESFYIDEDTDTPFKEIEKVQDILLDSFHPGLATLTCDQWLHTATLVVIAIINGLCSVCPNNLTPAPFVDLNLDETNSMNVLRKAISTLECYFTDPLTEHPLHWQLSHSKQDTRLSGLDTGGHMRQDQGFWIVCREQGSSTQWGQY
jgi:hypothetical protein